MGLFNFFENKNFNQEFDELLKLVNSSNQETIKNKPINIDEINYSRFGEYKELIKEFVGIFKNSFTEEQISNLKVNKENFEKREKALKGDTKAFEVIRDTVRRKTSRQSASKCVQL